MSGCTVALLFSVWNAELSVALLLCSITMMVTAQRKVYFPAHSYENTAATHFQTAPPSLSGKNHLHSMTQSVFAFALRTTQAITGPVLSGRGVFFGYETDNRASHYINHREKDFFLLLRKDILPFWFICHYIWTCLYLHYVHVAFTQNPQNMNRIKKKCHL